jgi:lincosamide nucleotidyltransferase A/C/D/E
MGCDPAVPRRYRGGVEAGDVIQVLDALDAAGVRHWVGGGWGVAALAGRQTRAHRDLDLNVNAEDLDRGLAALGLLGYVPETDWLPSRVELRAPGDRWVDVHPVAFDSAGNGRQHDMDGGFFEYPRGVFVRGLIGGRVVGCLSARQQRLFHNLGYEHRPQDAHDLAQLDELEAGANPGPGNVSA